MSLDKDLIRIILFILIFLVLLILLLLFQLLLPHAVCSFCVHAGEDQLKDFVIPGYGLAFDAFFDVLFR